MISLKTRVVVLPGLATFTGVDRHILLPQVYRDCYHAPHPAVDSATIHVHVNLFLQNLCMWFYFRK